MSNAVTTSVRTPLVTLYARVHTPAARPVLKYLTLVVVVNAHAARTNKRSTTKKERKR